MAETPRTPIRPSPGADHWHGGVPPRQPPPGRARTPKPAHPRTPHAADPLTPHAAKPPLSGRRAAGSRSASPRTAGGAPTGLCRRTARTAFATCRPAGQGHRDHLRTNPGREGRASQKPGTGRPACAVGPRRPLPRPARCPSPRGLLTIPPRLTHGCRAHRRVFSGQTLGCRRDLPPERLHPLRSRPRAGARSGRESRDRREGKGRSAPRTAACRLSARSGAGGCSPSRPASHARLARSRPAGRACALACRGGPRTAAP